ncbi:hypothetical protein HXZ60_13130 [Acinetobacter towneri]|uniref:hypothetical protein n=1 Tax=Acinetobacter TaxID=469 RepID=UPI001CE12D07|nr:MULTISPECIES: hypothetical protein [Acinetobacter]MDM1284471.1 hypothetical protein [Acinetobacter towneri]UBX42636.1 hypothetical protein LDO71_18925 [Acinetobacter baumannii]UNT63287.1 hypothetical protein IHE36_14465 [Acinetobacter towneri]
MKIKSVFLYFFIISATLTINSQSIAKPTLDAEEKNKVLDNIVKDLQSADSLLVKAFDNENYQEAARQQCRILNIYEELIDFTQNNPQLERSEKYGAAAEAMLARQYAQMQVNKVTKEMLCAYSLS